MVINQSGKRGSNSRPQPWQGCALPTELFPQFWEIFNFQTHPCQGCPLFHFLGQGCALPTELFPQFWEIFNFQTHPCQGCPLFHFLGQGCALPTELFPQFIVKRRRLELPRQYSHYPLKVARLPIPPPLHQSLIHRTYALRILYESGKRGSNSRPQPWQGCALPTELFPQFWEIFNFQTHPCQGCPLFHFLGQGCALPTELFPQFSRLRMQR